MDVLSSRILLRPADLDRSQHFYRDVLGLRVLSEPYVMTGGAIRDDMGELVSDPSMKAAIVGFGDDGDGVLEVIEYLGADATGRPAGSGCSTTTAARAPCRPSTCSSPAA